MRINKTIMFLIAVFLGLSACQETEKPESKPVIRPVVTMTVESPVKGREHRFSGMAKSPIETKLSFRVGGAIESLNVCVGDEVKAGDPIARLDPTDYKLKVQQLKAELARVQAGLQKSESDYGRFSRLFKKGNIAKSELDAARASFESNKALRASTIKSLELANKQLEYTTLYAPIDGHIAKVPIEAHQTVQAGMVVAVLTAGDLIEMDVGVPEQFIGRIEAGDSATIVFDAMSGREYEAVVTEVGVQALDTSTFPVTLKLVKPDPEVRPGMVGLATFFFKASQGDERVLVPAPAVVGGIDKKNFVWVYDPDSQTVKKCSVQVGNLTSYGLQIKEGLDPGDIVVTRGVHCLEEGIQVRLLDRP